MYAIGMRRVAIDYLVAIVSCDSDIDVVVAASVMTEFGREHFAFSPTPFPFGKPATLSLRLALESWNMLRTNAM